MPASEPLDHSALRRTCDPSQFNFSSTADIPILESVIGQERAVRAITFGLNMPHPGYHIFVTGQEGTGKRTIAQDIVSRHAEDGAPASDWCMVNNFDDPFRPRTFAVPPGRATTFAKSMDRLIRTLQIRLPRALAGETATEARQQMEAEHQSQEAAIIDTMVATARRQGIHVAKTTGGWQTIPLVDGTPMTHDQFTALPAERQAEIKAMLAEVNETVGKAVTELAALQATQKKAMRELLTQTAKTVIAEQMSDLLDTHADCEPIRDHLTGIQEEILENLEEFLAPGEADDGATQPRLPGHVFGHPFSVNVLVDNGKVTGAPVVFEPNPSFQNLFGTIDKKRIMGATVTDFSMVQAGSLLQANGGYLIVEIESLLQDPACWETLKRSLQHKALFIQEPPMGPITPNGTLRPAPIPLEVKLILIGHHGTFELLQNHDPKFNKTFQVRADFDYETDWTDTAIQQYARFVARVGTENGLRPFGPDAVAAIVEFGTTRVADQAKLSLRFGPIVAILHEADYWAGQSEAPIVTAAHVTKALVEHRFRYNLYEEKMQSAYDTDAIVIDVAGTAVGQVNALAVYQMGEISFGRPSRITAETYMGAPGIINIEREANMSGNTHDKGVMILSGYLGRTFARRHPLSVSISITFEQSYSGIDGDSASSTELYAILSSLSGVPIHQGIAVTGSVNQKGEVQTIGGVNQKIEGFYEVCRTKGLTGHQGVMIPAANVRNLMLADEVVTAVRDGQFHIYPVATIAEGIETLTGVTAGDAGPDGRYPAESVYGRVQATLRDYLTQAIQLNGYRHHDATLGMVDGPNTPEGGVS